MAMTIGEVINALLKASAEMPVSYDFCGLVPTRVSSWRGIYAEAAIGFSDSYNSKALATVGPFLGNLKEAIHSETRFDGYKGGTYRFKADTPLHVDNPSDCTYTEIARIEVTEWRVIIHTVHEG